jgi:MFS transporter, DHA2 family, multidrug resistance protein
LTGYLTSKIDPRKIIVVGLILGAITMFDLSRLNLNAGYWDIFWPQVLQGVALAFLFIPLMALSMSSIPKEKMGNATSIFNLMRNIGGSFGIAIMTTFLGRRAQFHQSRLVANLTSGSLKTREMIAGMQAWFYSHGIDAVSAQRKALAAAYGMLQAHASMLSFVEAFWVLGIIFLAMLPFVLLLRRPPRTSLREASLSTDAVGGPELASEMQEDEAQHEAELVMH